MIYLDYAATTPCDPQVLDEMYPFFREHFGNASSTDHVFGVRAKEAVEDSRRAIATLMQCKVEEVIFTSGATEANALVMQGANRILSTSVEHPSVIEAIRSRASDADGLLKLRDYGRVDLHHLKTLLAPLPATLVSVIATNNETGVEHDISQLASTVATAAASLHIDATQAIATREISFEKLPGLSAASISAHKIMGPKGIGALIARSNIRRQIIASRRSSGAHEHGLRSGTLNVPGIVGFGVAAKLLHADRSKRRDRLILLRKVFLETLRAALGNQVCETIDSDLISPHILSIRFEGTNGRALLRALRGVVAFSLGSACATNKSEPSHVLLALGLTKQQIASSVRFSFSHELEADTAKDAARQVAMAVADLSRFSLIA